MKGIIVLLALVAVISGDTRLGGQLRQSYPDFSGTWSGQDGTLTITQDARFLTVTAGEQIRIYNFDGSESRFQGAKGDRYPSQMTARIRWTGSAVVVAETTVSPIGTWEDLLVYSLDYGPRLNVVRVGSQTTQPMMYTRITTYDKQ